MSFPIKNGDFPVRYVKLPEGNLDVPDTKSLEVLLAEALLAPAAQQQNVLRRHVAGAIVQLVKVTGLSSPNLQPMYKTTRSMVMNGIYNGIYIYNWFRIHC